MPTLQDIARDARSHFTVKERESGASFYALHDYDTAPAWVHELIQSAHDQGGGNLMLPDDWRYRFIVDALDAIADCDPDPADPWDALQIRLDSDVDVMNGDLCQWLASNMTRHAYVDEQMEDLGMGWPDRGVMNAIQIGQLAEREEVARAVVHALQARLITAEDEDDDES